MKCIIGKKLGMTTIHDAEKGARNLTLIDCGSNVVSLVRTKERDGYVAVQIETDKTAKRKVKKEFRMEEAEASAMPVGTSISLESFELGELVHVTGTMKAKGFQGVVKRHGFKGQTTSHGRKHDMRKPGSLGATDPEHVFKGKRMAGRMGGTKFTVQNLKVEYIDTAKGILGLRGAVPGVVGRIVTVKSAK